MSRNTLQQQQDTPKRKTGYSERNGNAGEKEISLKNLGSDEATNPTCILNGGRQVVDIGLRPTGKTSTFGKAGLKTAHFIQKNSVAKRNGKSYENKSGENQSADKCASVAIPNGVVTNNSGSITNGYMDRGADTHGSGAEGRYTTPNKRKARCKSAKCCEILSLVQDQVMQQETSTPTLKQRLDTFKPDHADQREVEEAA